VFEHVGVVARVKSVSITEHGGYGNRRYCPQTRLAGQSLFWHRQVFVDFFSPFTSFVQDYVQLMQHAQFAQALALSLCSGLAATLLALGASACILSTGLGLRTQRKHAARLPAMLALPHVAFALGCVLLLAPSGWLVRLLFALLRPWAQVMPWALDVPPPWQSTQDPWALGLVLVLVCKEIPFLLWGALAHMQGPDVAQVWQAQMRVASTLGYSAPSAWWRVVWPQLLPRMAGPLLAVWAYSLTVVDVAWIIGPGAPPTLNVLAWQWLQHADPAIRALGLAAVVGLLFCTVLVAGLAWMLYRIDLRLLAPVRWTRGPQCLTHAKGAKDGAFRATIGRCLLRTLPAGYALVAVALLWGSVAGAWPFPALWPQSWTLQAWQQVMGSASVLGTTLFLGMASAATALVLAVACLECLPARWRKALFGASYVQLALPNLLWAIGLQRLCIALGWDASAWGLWLAHSASVWPYVLLSLQGPYAALDPRGAQLAASLGRSHGAYLWQVQWPLLRAALAAAFAVGFAVSVAQFLPTLFVGGGRFATVTTEAVALSAGGQRSLLAAFALLQWLLPACLFVLALWLGRKRRFVQPLAARTLA
jgi:putative thiamine transport system permease protein